MGERNVGKRQLGTKIPELGAGALAAHGYLIPPPPCPEWIKKVGSCVVNALWLL